ncbi:transposase, partial [Yanghanlia caeni]|nr:transposase [Alcaligenaceae bacterium LG-2]
MSKNNKFSPEVRERAVRLVQEHRGEYSSLWAATQSIAPKIGCSAHTLLKWVQLQEVEAGTRSGVPQAEQERIKALERENKELRRANESSLKYSFQRLFVRFMPPRATVSERRDCHSSGHQAGRGQGRPEPAWHRAFREAQKNRPQEG